MAQQLLVALTAIIACTVLVSLYGFVSKTRSTEPSETKCGQLLEKLVQSVTSPQAPCNCDKEASGRQEAAAHYEQLITHLQAEVKSLREQLKAPAPKAVVQSVPCPSPPECPKAAARCSPCPEPKPCSSPEPSEPVPAANLPCKDLKERATFLDGKVGQVVQIMKTYMGKYQDCLHSSEDYEMAAIAEIAQLKGAEPAPYYRKRENPVNVAILTPQEGPGNAMTKMSAYTKEQYCKIHGYDFIFDTSAYAANHTRHATWNRVPSVQKHLPHYDWILYMDSDIALTNTSILLEDFIHKFPADARIAFTDGLEGFNAGAFFIKNDPWSYWLLDAWWNASEPNPGAKCTASKDAGFMFHRCKFQWNDQVALWDAMLPYYAEAGKTGKRVTCKTSPSTDWQASIACYRDTMIKLGYPYGKRSAHHFYFWPLEQDPRGWTFFQLDRRGLSVWPEKELFHPGDFALHSHDDKAVLRFSIYRQMAAREEKRKRAAK